jgi:hypothetical protein
MEEYCRDTGLPSADVGVEEEHDAEHDHMGAGGFHRRPGIAVAGNNPKFSFGDGLLGFAETTEVGEVRGRGAHRRGPSVLGRHVPDLRTR